MTGRKSCFACFACFVVLLSVLFTLPTFAQNVPAGVGQGWLPEFDHATSQLVALAEATPADKFAWRPAAGVRSVAEVYMHVAVANYYLVSQTGVKLPPDVNLSEDLEKRISGKAAVIQWLKNSQEFVRAAYGKADLQRKTKLFGRDTTVDAIYLRILIHNNEHMGQSIAYARMNGIVPPWSR